MMKKYITQIILHRKRFPIWFDLLYTTLSIVIPYKTYSKYDIYCQLLSLESLSDINNLSILAKIFLYTFISYYGFKTIITKMVRYLII